jgi:hypothetical protein
VHYLAAGHNVPNKTKVRSAQQWLPRQPEGVG